LLTVVYVNWSVWLVRPSVSGVLNSLDFPIVPEAWNFNYCPAGSVAEFVFSAAASHSIRSFWTFRLHIYIYIGVAT
jgi:hypothetical protein